MMSHPSFLQAFNFWKEKIINNKGATVVLLSLSVSLLIVSFYRNNMAHVGAYLGAMALGAYVTEWYVQSRKMIGEMIVIKKPGRELRLLIIILIAQLTAAIVRFVLFPDWNHAPFPVKIATLGLMLLFIYPVFLAVYLLWIGKYKLTEIGFRVRSNVWTTIPAILITAMAAFLFAPHKIQFAEILGEMGIAQMFLLGFASAAVPEEVMRFFCQTRISFALRSKTWGWVITSVLWAAIHIPNFSSQSIFLEGILSAIGIIPIGLLWGYMTYRLNSIWPSIMFHGTNLWGIQNVI